MDLQTFLEEKFKWWQPTAPVVLDRTKCTVSMRWEQEVFTFISERMMYKIEMKDRMPPWLTVYSGGKTTRTIDNLPPRHPQRFRLKVILKATGVPLLSEKAIQFYGSEKFAYDQLAHVGCNDVGSNIAKVVSEEKVDGTGDGVRINKTIRNCNDHKKLKEKRKIDKLDVNHGWLESMWSPETWTNTDTDGTSVICFSMAVRCGYIKQVQVMLEERPELIEIVNSTNGLTPLATAVKKGDINMVRFLISAGADLNQHSATGQTPLHLAVLLSYTAIAELLLDKGANPLIRDNNGMLIEHYAVDSGSLEMLQSVLARGGDVSATDNNGWTPLFRALCQDANTDIIEELVSRGSDLGISDNAGLPMTSAAKLLKNKQGRSRDSILRLVDTQYPHDKALANFTRLTKKIHHVQTMFK